MIKKVNVPQHVRSGIKKNHRAAPIPKNLRLFGCDTETVRGRPHTFQIHDGKKTILKYVNKDNVFWEFWKSLKKGCRAHGVNLAYFHNLRFDLPILFSKYHREMYQMFNDVQFEIKEKRRKISVKMIYGKVNAATISEGDISVRLLDSFHFTQTSLERSAGMFQIPFEKKPRPEGLGREYLDDAEFEDYAKTDVVVEYHLARKILDFHDEYKVSPCVSLPQFSSKVFRHFYFKEDTVIQFPPRDVCAMSESSYHGGKNGFYLDSPCVKENVYEVDINSSYPHAMTKLPQLTLGTYDHVTAFEPGACGVYKISGWANPERRYPILFDAGFKRVDGKFENIDVTSFELAEMTGPHYTWEVQGGAVWTPEPYATNPFVDFVTDFYRKKETTPKSEKAMYNFYKITLNALYGKFISAIEKRDASYFDAKAGGPVGVDLVWDKALQKYMFIKKEFEASGMYNPFVGTLITGFARAHLYQMEKKYEALHSATDSVKTLICPDELSGLGGHKLECFGTCYFFRNKFYLHYSHTFDGCSHKRGAAPMRGPEHLCKIALHGYKAKTDKGIAHLIDHRDEFLETHHLTYDYEHVVGLREGFKRNETPMDFVGRSEVVCLCVGSDVSCQDAGNRCHCYKTKN